MLEDTLVEQNRRFGGAISAEKVQSKCRAHYQQLGEKLLFRKNKDDPARRFVSVTTQAAYSFAKTKDITPFSVPLLCL